MNFNGKYWHKPGHLGMTRAELLEKLNGEGGGGSFVLLDTEYDSENYIYVTKDEYSFDDLKAIFSEGKLPAIYSSIEDVQTTEEEKLEAYAYGLLVFYGIEYLAASDADPTIAVPYSVKCEGVSTELIPDLDDISTFNKTTKYFWKTRNK